MDDSTVTEEVSNPADSHLQEDTDNSVQWSDDNHMKINGKKNKEMVISFNKVPPFVPSLKINGLDIDRVTISKPFGIYVSSDLKWGPHVDKIHAKAFKRLYFLTCLKWAGVEENELLGYYRSVIRSVVAYACPSWATGITKGQSDSLEQIQKRAIYYSSSPAIQETITKFNLPTIKDRLDILNSNFFRNIVDNDSHRLHHLLPKPHAVKRNLCSTGKYELPKCCTNRFKTSFNPHALFNYQE